MKRLLRYLPVFSLPILVYISFTSRGWVTFLPLIEAFALIPLLELLIKPDPGNISEKEEQQLLNSPVFDLLVYAIISIHLVLLMIYLSNIADPVLTTTDIIGRTSAMGLLCGVFGINVAHELGHRKKKGERILAKMLLLTSMYMHFIIEHNRGHHRNVSTDDDPASARFGEMLYSFWFRSIIFSYLSAWKLEAMRLRKKGLPVVSLHNEMILFQLIQLALLGAIFMIFGWFTLLCFMLSAGMGILLLETVNYIEHYGLRREKTKKGTYERVMPRHSWNSDHVVGRMMLFELSRHSDHHYLASRKYQILRHMDDSPQMPTGYPGMMILAFLPGLWFNVMHHRLQAWTTHV